MKKDKNVLILASVASMIDQFNMPNIELLLEMGFNVHVACNFIEGSTCSKERIAVLKNNLSNLGVEYYQIDFKRNVLRTLENIKAYKQVLNLMKNTNYKFVHCHSPVGGFCGRLAARKTKTKVIYTAHGFHFYKGAPLLNWIIYYPIEKWLSKYTDVLITINKEDYQNALNKKFMSKNVIYLNGVGVNLEKFKPQKQCNKFILREQYCYGTNDFILLYAGELSYRKHQDLLIKVAAKLKNKIPNFKILFAGIGDLKEQYAKQINELDVNSQVQLLGFRKDIDNLMNIADVAVSSSRQEGLPVNIMEAMATGLPLVVTNCRGNIDLVSDNENGFVVEMDDVQKFADAVEKLYRMVKLRQEFGRKSLSLIDNYSTQNVMKEIKLIYANYL